MGEKKQENIRIELTNFIIFEIVQLLFLKWLQ